MASVATRNAFSPSAQSRAPLLTLWAVSTMLTAYMSATVFRLVIGSTRSTTIVRVRSDTDCSATKAVPPEISNKTARRVILAMSFSLIVMTGFRLDLISLSTSTQIATLLNWDVSTSQNSLSLCGNDFEMLQPGRFWNN
ncbi:hypothetical protein EDC40_104591 [Aminobacter aminovorans]|uniref:Uncharacterized protein n=1 Tax=Aminobacter aminovorans TaxID=83263 RepID=A0A380WFN1_AMIAI|nr:hypothetical protein EDC40_104591 [Aminobacter aminovorans]SUU87823.1 Uncharacterised protein [Aminobacter aminovorans]